MKTTYISSVTVTKIKQPPRNAVMEKTETSQRHLLSQFTTQSGIDLKLFVEGSSMKDSVFSLYQKTGEETWEVLTLGKGETGMTACKKEMLLTIAIASKLGDATTFAIASILGVRK